MRLILFLPLLALAARFDHPVAPAHDMTPCALRCECRPDSAFGPTRAAQLEVRSTRASAVLLGRVLDTLPKRGRTPPMARVLVARWWKGAPRDTLLVAQQPSTSYATSCDWPLTVGREYLLFLSRTPEGWLVNTQCGGSRQRPDAEADSVIALLERQRAAQAAPAVRAPGTR